jgi:hemoglobin-like flavoprotein
MSLDVQALRDSFALVAEQETELARRFYAIFFLRYPQVRGLFGRNTQAQQEKMLTQALAAVVDHLEDAPWLTSTLRALGARHEGYGVRPEMYDWVGECLLAALAEVAGDAFTPRVRDAWAQAYAAIAALMQTPVSQREPHDRPTLTSAYSPV